MTWPIVDLTFWSPGQPGADEIDALLANPATPLAKHGLTGIAAAYARETGADLHDIHREWDAHLTSRSLSVDGALVDVATLFDENSIPYFVAKGPVTAQTLYPDAGLRPYCDLDIYVPASIDQRARALLRSEGFVDVHHSRGVLDGLANEMYGGRFGATVEVHNQLVDNLHRRHVPPIEEMLPRVERHSIRGHLVPTLDRSAHGILQAVHAAAGHRYAKLILLRDLHSALPYCSQSDIQGYGLSGYVSIIAALLDGFGRTPDCAVPRPRRRNRITANSLLRVDPASWDEYAKTIPNLLALLAQPRLSHSGRVAIRLFATAHHQSGRRVNVRPGNRSESSRVTVDVGIGLPVDRLTTDELTNATIELSRGRRPAAIGNQNLHGTYLYLAGSETFRTFFGVADIVHADGMGFVALARLKGQPLNRCHRTTYLDWLPTLLSVAEDAAPRVFLLGGTEQSVERARHVLLKRHPRLTMDLHHGYFDATSEAELKVVEARLWSFAPHLVLVGMGMPRQEEWYVQRRQHLPPAAYLMAGGCFDYLSGQARTPPRYAGQIGLEWAFRLGNDPRRLASRYLVEPVKLASHLVARGGGT